jgi:hypothetical protein
MGTKKLRSKAISSLPTVTVGRGKTGVRVYQEDVLKELCDIVT